MQLEPGADLEHLTDPRFLGNAGAIFCIRDLFLRLLFLTICQPQTYFAPPPPPSYQPFRRFCRRGPSVWWFAKQMAGKYGEIGFHLSPCLALTVWMLQRCQIRHKHTPAVLSVLGKGCGDLGHSFFSHSNKDLGYLKNLSFVPVQCL